MNDRILGIPCLVVSIALWAGCSAPPLEHEPWAMMEPGAWALSLIQPVWENYEVDALFTADIPGGEMVTERDSEPIEGKYALVLAADYFLTKNLSIQGGIDYRKYEIDNLQPEGLPPVKIDAIDSLQYFLGLRYHLPPLESNPRWRPYVGAHIAYLPTVEINAEVQFDPQEFPGLGNLEIDSEGKGYWVAAGLVGMMYQWSDPLVFRGGVLYEYPLTPLEADLTLDFGKSGSVPFFVELEPQGPVVFLGITWFL